MNGNSNFGLAGPLGNGASVCLDHTVRTMPPVWRLFLPGYRNGWPTQ